MPTVGALPGSGPRASREGCIPVSCSRAAVKLAACEGGVFPLQKGVSASSTSVRIVRCCRSSSYPVFSPVSGVIFPRVVVNWLCPREEVSSESAYATILTSLSLFCCHWAHTDAALNCCYQDAPKTLKDSSANRIRYRNSFKSALQ